MRVWLVRSPEDWLAYHDFIGIEQGGQVTYYECLGWTKTSLVDQVLAAAGATSGSSSTLQVVSPDPATAVVKLKGFVVPAGNEGAVRSMVQRALTGDLGGFHPVVMGQIGVHRAPMAFEYLWGAAGCPVVVPCHPDFVEGAAAEKGGPSPLAAVAKASATLAAIRGGKG
jgi:hypothetical protein